MSKDPTMLGESSDVCDVCRTPITDLSSGLAREYDSRLLTFCSEKCFSTYLSDPQMYAEYEGDELDEL